MKLDIGRRQSNWRFQSWRRRRGCSGRNVHPRWWAWETSLRRTGIRDSGMRQNSLRFKSRRRERESSGTSIQSRRQAWATSSTHYNHKAKTRRLSAHQLGPLCRSSHLRLTIVMWRLVYYFQDLAISVVQYTSVGTPLCAVTFPSLQIRLSLSSSSMIGSGYPCDKM